MILKQKLSLNEQLEFLNLWHVIIVGNDLLIILGTLFKLSGDIEEGESYISTGLFLGFGAFFVYIGLLRYMKFFDRYNVRIFVAFELNAYSIARNGLFILQTFIATHNDAEEGFSIDHAFYDLCVHSISGLSHGWVGDYWAS